MYDTLFEAVIKKINLMEIQEAQSKLQPGNHLKMIKGLIKSCINEGIYEQE